MSEPNFLRRSAARASRRTGHHNLHAMADAILPTDFFSTLRQRFPYQGERQLLGAILEDAVHCFQKHLFHYGARERRVFRDAEAWLFNEPSPSARRESRSVSISFQQVCTALAIDGVALRNNIRRWRQHRLLELTRLDASHTASLPIPPNTYSPRSVIPLRNSAAPF